MSPASCASTAASPTNKQLDRMPSATQPDGKATVGTWNGDNSRIVLCIIAVYIKLSKREHIMFGIFVSLRFFVVLPWRLCTPVWTAYRRLMLMCGRSRRGDDEALDHIDRFYGGSASQKHAETALYAEYGMHRRSNYLSFHLADGAVYRPYQQVPVWDWSLIPTITVDYDTTPVAVRHGAPDEHMSVVSMRPENPFTRNPTAARTGSSSRRTSES